MSLRVDPQALRTYARQLADGRPVADVAGRERTAAAIDATHPRCHR